MLKPESQPVVLTVGHSTRPLEAFINLLEAHAATHLIDVRTVPHSRHNPQFNRDTFSYALESAGIRYMHAVGLEGFRRTSRESPNRGWRNEAFRGFADYMLCPFGKSSKPYRRGKAKAYRVDVRRGRIVALPSLADRRRAAGSRGSGRRNHQRDAEAVAYDHAFRQGGRHVNQLSTLV